MGEAKGLGVTQSKASVGSACLTRGVVGRGRHWDLEADCGRKIRAGEESPLGGHKERSLGRWAAPRHVGVGSTRAESFSLGQNTSLYLLTSRPVGSGRERARPEVRASLPRKRRKEAEPRSCPNQTEWRPLRLGVGSQCLTPRRAFQGCEASRVPPGPNQELAPPGRRSILL